MFKRQILCILVVFILTGLIVSSFFPPAYASEKEDEGMNVQAELRKDRVRIKVDGKLFTDYKFSDDLKYPYFYPVNGPRSGESVTTETSEPYPHHHSLFFGCDKVNEGNYWQDTLERGQIISEKVTIEKAEGACVEFTQICIWKRPGAESPFRDTRRIRVSAPSSTLRVIDFELTATALIDVTILKTNHSLFSARMVPELSVNEGGTLVNAQGDTSEKGTWGVHSPWCDYWGSRDGVTEGLAIFNHPGNPWTPPPWFTRDYGFFSPTPMYWLEGDRLDLDAGEGGTLRYRVVVHEGDTKTAGIAQLYDEYQRSME